VRDIGLLASKAFLFSVDVWMIVLIWKQKRTVVSWKLLAAAPNYGSRLRHLVDSVELAAAEEVVAVVVEAVK
jgi:hypothetical protein